MTAVLRCPCGASLGKFGQLGLPTTGVVELCVACRTKEEIRKMLALLPEEGEMEFDVLSEYEQEFLPSVRRQFAVKGTLSEKQIEILDRIYKRTA